MGFPSFQVFYGIFVFDFGCFASDAGMKQYIVRKTGCRGEVCDTLGVKLPVKNVIEAFT
jgi:hypothetical protein